MPPDTIKVPVLVEVGWKHSEWRTAYRKLEPEAQEPAFGTLRRAWTLNRARGIGELAPRRKDWSQRGQDFLRGSRTSS